MVKYISLTQGMGILLNTISQNLKHVDYKKVTELSEEYNIYITGENVSKKLIQFVPRESAQLFAQRIALTQVTTPDIAGGCMKPMYKVGRAPATVQLQWKDTQTTETKKKELLTIADNFYGDVGVNDYLTYKMVELDSTDPNSFIVIESNGAYDSTKPISDTNQKLKPYPFEVSSKEAINYFYDNNVLQYLIVKNCIAIKDSKNKIMDGEKYTIYTELNSAIALEIERTVLKSWLNSNEYVDISEGIPEVFALNVNYYFHTNEKSASERRHFLINIYEHKIGFVPAKRVGTIKDLTTRARTCVPVIHLAKCYLEKSIKYDWRFMIDFLSQIECNICFDRSFISQYVYSYLFRKNNILENYTNEEYLNIFKQYTQNLYKFNYKYVLFNHLHLNLIHLIHLQNHYRNHFRCLFLLQR
jgi:hypothetical protein